MPDRTSSTFAEELRLALMRDDVSRAYALLEKRLATSDAQVEERLLAGVLLLLPPMVDEDAASRHFQLLLDGPRRLEAAVWDAYRFATLLPDGSRAYESVLRANPQSAVAAYATALVARQNGDMEMAHREALRSMKLRRFPYSILQFLELDPNLRPDVRRQLWLESSDLVISRSAETDAPVQTVEGMLQRLWENLIIGTRLSTPVWEDLSSRFGG